MTVSPASIRFASSATVLPANAAGTITHAARGFVSLATKSSRDSEPVAPSDSSSATESGFTS